MLNIYKESRDIPSIAMVIPAMDHIDEHLATAALSAAYPKAIKAVLAIGKKTLNRYYMLQLQRCLLLSLTVVQLIFILLSQEEFQQCFC